MRKELLLIDTATGEDVWCRELANAMAQPLPGHSFSPAGKRFAIRDRNGFVICDTDTGNPTREIRAPGVDGTISWADDSQSFRVSKIKESPSLARLPVQWPDQKVAQCWEFNVAGGLSIIRDGVAFPTADLGNGNRDLAVTSDGNFLAVFEARSGKLRARCLMAGAAINAAVSADGSIVAAQHGNDNPQLFVWRIKD